MIARLPAMRAPDWLRRRVEGCLRRRTASEGTRIALDRRRLFVLPTRLGYTFAATLALLLVGSLNYNASLGFALTFLLAGCGALGMLHTYRNLEGLVLAFAPAAPVFAGETARFPIEVQAPERERWAVVLTAGDRSQTVEAVTPDAPCHTHVAVPTIRRGRLALPRLTVTTRWPLPLFRVWSRLQPAAAAVVYPAPVDHGRPRPWTAGNAGAPAAPPGADEFAGLREYRPGDPPRRIAWKALARTDELRIKDFDAAVADETWLDWASLEALGPEARLEQLCAWVIAADGSERPYGLVLPDARIAPGTGAQHRHRCLEALALTGPAAAERT